MSHVLQSIIEQIQPLDVAAMQAARQRQDQLTKPQGSLGQLEEISIKLAGISAQPRPRFRQPAIIIAAADHGITQQGVSAYPGSVTPQMVANFLQGNAAINVLARHVGARVLVADLGVASDIPAHPDLLNKKVAYGTRDFSSGPAMSGEEAIRSVAAGVELAQQAIDQGADIIGTGEMGIGNTTASSAVVTAITGQPVQAVTGRGTGIDDATLARKVAVIEQALALHRPDPANALAVLGSVGGFEIGAIAGMILGASARRVPVVLDGFIAGAGALIACGLAPAVQPYLIAAHVSVERGHQTIFEHLELAPLLDLGLRLGEGSGAALGIHICIAASKILDEMATFAEAGVDKRTDENG